MIFKGKYTTAETKTDLLEGSLISQIYEFINNPVFENPIKIMPDCHAGIGSCVGFTMAMGDKINPQIIGDDIGCGMFSVKMGFDITDELSLAEIDRKIREAVPMGFSTNGNDENFKSYFNFKEISKRLKRNYDSRDFFGKILANKKIKNRVKNSIGSLGGGNHFIEIGKDEDGYFWITVHTGSRNFGKVICDYHTEIAKKYASDSYKEKYKSAVEKIKAEFPKKEWEKEIKKISIPKPNEFYLEGKLKDEYLRDMQVAQYYAEINRKVIMTKILNVFDKYNIIDEIETVHNYINFDDNIIRKGAISAHKGELVVIPWNMRDGLIIAKGKGNADWNYSAPHGAGRKMSRGKAKAEIDLETFKEQMEGIYSSSVCQSTLDEAPDAYKDYEIVKNEIQDTVEIIHTVKPVLNIKSC